MKANWLIAGSVLLLACNPKPNYSTKHRNFHWKPDKSTKEKKVIEYGYNFNSSLPKRDKKLKSYKVNPAIKQVINLESGTQIEVPENAFVDASGRPVKAAVNLKFRELFTKEDIVSSGIPMRFNDNSGEGHMRSAGMFEIQAEAAGAPVAIAPNKDIQVKFASFTPAPGFDQFILQKKDNGKDEWVRLGSSVAVENKVRAEKIEEIKQKQEDADRFFTLKFDVTKTPELEKYNSYVWKFIGKKGSKYDPKKYPVDMERQWANLELTPMDTLQDHWFTKNIYYRNTKWSIAPNNQFVVLSLNDQDRQRKYKKFLPDDAWGELWDYEEIDIDEVDDVIQPVNRANGPGPMDIKGKSPQNGVVFFNKAGKQIGELKTKESVTEFKYSSDNQYVGGSTRDGLYIWKLGESVSEALYVPDFRQSYTSGKQKDWNFSNDSKRVIVVAERGKMKAYDLATKQAVINKSLTTVYGKTVQVTRNNIIQWKLPRVYNNITSTRTRPITKTPTTANNVNTTKPGPTKIYVYSHSGKLLKVISQKGRPSMVQANDNGDIMAINTGSDVVYRKATGELIKTVNLKSRVNNWSIYGGALPGNKGLLFTDNFKSGAVHYLLDWNGNKVTIDHGEEEILDVSYDFKKYVTRYGAGYYIYDVASGERRSVVFADNNTDPRISKGPTFFASTNNDFFAYADNHFSRLKLNASKNQSYSLYVSAGRRSFVTIVATPDAKTLQEIKNTENEIKERKKREWEAELARVEAQAKFQRVFSVRQFGIYNVDQIERTPELARVNATFRIDGKKAKSNLTMYHITGEKGDMVIKNYLSKSFYSVSANWPNGFLVILSGDEAAVISNEEFNKLSRSGTDMVVDLKKVRMPESDEGLDELLNSLVKRN